MSADILAMIIGLVGTVLIGLVVLIPVIGFTLRFALRPWVNRVLALMESRQQAIHSAEETKHLQHRISLLEQEMHMNSRQLETLSERTDFYEKLGRPGDGAPLRET